MLTGVSEMRISCIIRAMIEVVRISETSVNIYLTTQKYIPEDSKLDWYRLCIYFRSSNLRHFKMVDAGDLNYNIEITFGEINSTLNFMKHYQLVQRFSGGRGVRRTHKQTYRQRDSLVISLKPPFIFKVN
jgi:hypothetical protein